MMIGKRGYTIQSYPPQHSPFWKALRYWIKQGERVENGECIYELPPPEVWLKVTSRDLVPNNTGNLKRFPKATPIILESD